MIYRIGLRRLNWGGGGGSRAKQWIGEGVVGKKMGVEVYGNILGGVES